MEELVKENDVMARYSVIDEKNKREIVLLRGSGCRWRRCRFCDYHLDYCTDNDANFELNKAEIQKVTGIYGKLEAINSGSFVDLDENTMELLCKTCVEKKINEIHFECHYKYREAIPAIKERFAALGVKVKIKIGVETFDALFRESYLDKGIVDDNNHAITDPAVIAKYFDECCLLLGIPGQTEQSMKKDIETGLKYFDRVCVNIMQENGKPIKPDPEVIKIFADKIYPLYAQNIRVDILMENTAFGVGGVLTND